VTAIDTGTDNGGITLSAADGRNIVLTNATGGLTAGNTGLGLAGASGNTAIATGTVTLVSDGNKPITISSGRDRQCLDVGFAEGTYNGTQVQVSSNLTNDGSDDGRQCFRQRRLGRTVLCHRRYRVLGRQ
jgi:flagellin